MIAATPSPSVAYLWEPFSVLHRPGVCDVRFPYWFPYVCGENGASYEKPVENMLAFRYATRAELGAVRSPKDVARLVRDRSRFARWRRAGARPLLKDPIAVYSAEWLCDTFDMEVLVVIRHPAAFSSSVVGRRLRHPFGDFLAQPLLMRDMLGPFDDQIRRFAASEQPLIDQAILLWNLIHHPIVAYRERRPSWQFLRLEDVARDPGHVFRALYEHLGLTFDERVRATIDEHSAPGNPIATADPASHKRDSRASVEAWRGRFSDAEVERIRAGVEPIAKEFYSDDDWAPVR
jgi:hypothetical protein